MSWLIRRLLKASTRGTVLDQLQRVIGGVSLIILLIAIGFKGPKYRTWIRRVATSALSHPLRTGAKIQSSTKPLGKDTRFFIPCVRCLQHLIGDFVDEEIFFILVE